MSPSPSSAQTADGPGDVEGRSRYSNTALIFRLVGLAGRYKSSCFKVLGLQLVLLVLGLGGLSLTGYGIDYIRYHVSTPEGPAQLDYPVAKFGLAVPTGMSPMKGIFAVGGIILLMAAMRAFLNYHYSVSLNQLVQQRVVVDLRAEIYAKLQKMSFRFFDANTTGSIITRATADVQSVRMFLDQVLIQMFIMVISLTVYIAYMASLSPGLTLACLASTPLLWVASALFSARIRPEYDRNRKLADRLVQYFTESIQGVQVNKAFGREALDREAFELRNKEVYDQQFGIFWKISLYTPAVVFMTRVNIAILLGYGGWEVIHGNLPLGTGLVVFAGLLEQYSGQVTQVTNIVNSIQQSFIGARRVFEILDSPVEVQSAPDAQRCEKLSGRVTLENAGFAYSGIDPVLRNIDLDVAPGQCVAILGMTGSGKSVLMSLIPRFFDVTEGAVKLDGIDVRRLNLEDLRKNIGIVFQESFLFSNTVAANIAFGHPRATREQIERAARQAAAHEFILKLPDGYETVLAENGQSLSGGQRQRLAIARALLLEPPILLLDDPTAAIDSETEHEIFEAMDRAMAGRTTFIVAHRLSTLRRADFVIVMERGRIVQRGTHAELMAKPGPYRRLAELQLVDAEELRDLGEESSHG
jgi:ABC-type multidrug transport system fused ATPase/permease subunit